MTGHVWLPTNAESLIFEVLEAHTFNKALGRCHCGTELPTKGHRTREWRQHAAEQIKETLVNSPTLTLVRGAVTELECRCDDSDVYDGYAECPRCVLSPEGTES